MCSSDLDEFSLMIENGESLFGNYQVYDMQGKLVETGTFQTGIIQRFGREYHPGLYLLVATLNDEKKVLRIVKQ